MLYVRKNLKENFLGNQLLYILGAFTFLKHFHFFYLSWFCVWEGEDS